MKDGDHPDTIFVTYQRCNAAAEMVEDLLEIFPAEEWARLATQMMDRDLLADDEWWDALMRRRRRKRNRTGSDLPSYSTRVTAGHQMAVAAKIAGSSTVSRSPAPHSGAPHSSSWTMTTARAETFKRSSVCEADGLHHKLCPRHVTYSTATQFVAHHVFPREKAKQQSIAYSVVDIPDNLIVVWNGETGMGAGGCHGKIHSERTSARMLGLLAPKGAAWDDWHAER